MSGPGRHSGIHLNPSRAVVAHPVSSPPVLRHATFERFGDGPVPPVDTTRVMAEPTFVSSCTPQKNPTRLF